MHTEPKTSLHIRITSYVVYNVHPFGWTRTHFISKTPEGSLALYLYLMGFTTDLTELDNVYNYQPIHEDVKAIQCT